MGCLFELFFEIFVGCYLYSVGNNRSASYLGDSDENDQSFQK